MNSSRVQDPTEASASIFRLLISSRFTDKYTAIDWLNDSTRKIDRTLLRSLILEALRTEYSVETELTFQDRSIGDTRSWLLSALGRISALDDEATEEIVKHIDSKFEPREWPRYWALEGLISGKNQRVFEIARRASENTDDLLLNCLAFAYLASNRDRQAQEFIKNSFENKERQWFVLRALRIVPLPFAVPTVCKLVEAAEYTDATYDAIVALGRLPSGSSQAPTAAQALSAAISKMRGKPWLDGMRTAAITALGSLAVR